MASDAKQKNQGEEDRESGGDAGTGAPWWHEDAAEFASDPESSPSNAEETSELLTTATQEAVQLAATLSTWAEKTGFTPILRSVAQQAMETAQDAAGSLMSSGDSSDGSSENSDDIDQAASELDIDIEGVDLESDDFSHLDADPAAAGVVHVNHEAEAGEGRITCDYCPVCRVIESLDDLNPETAAAIAEVMAVFTDGVASAVMELVSKGSDDNR